MCAVARRCLAFRIPQPGVIGLHISDGTERGRGGPLPADEFGVMSLRSKLSVFTGRVIIAGHYGSPWQGRYFKRSLSETVTFESRGEKLKPSIIEKKKEKKKKHWSYYNGSLFLSRRALGASNVRGSGSGLKEKRRWLLSDTEIQCLFLMYSAQANLSRVDDSSGWRVNGIFS